MKNVEKMAKEIVSFLKKKKMWETDTGIIYDGKHITHRGTFPKEEKTPGVARMWFEGPLNHAINYGTGDPQFKIYNKIKEIVEKHGFHLEFGTNCDFNIYDI